MPLFIKKFVYPSYKVNVQLRNATFSAFLVLLFIILFKPFDYNLITPTESLIILSFVGFIVFVFCTLHQWIVLWIIRRKRKTLNWIQEVSIWLGLVIFVSQVIYFFTVLAGYNSFSPTAAILYFFPSFLLSSIPFLFFLYIKSLGKNGTVLEEVFPIVNEGKWQTGSLKKIVIQDYTIDPELISVVKSEDNYIRIYYRKDTNEHLEKILVRGTMKNFLKKLEGKSNIVRVHRSYAVNIKEISSIEGNNLNSKIVIKEVSEKVPASRTKAKEIRQLWKVDASR